MVGYARVSTLEQDPALQLDALTAAGAVRVFTDCASAVTVAPQLPPPALAAFGRMDFYGMAGCPPTPIQAPSLMGTSRAVIGFWLAHCMSRPEMMGAAMAELLPMVADGSLRPVGGGRYPLTTVHEGYQDLLARRTTGKLVLDPTR